MDSLHSKVIDAMGIIRFAAEYAANKIMRAAAMRALLQDAIKVESRELLPYLETGRVVNVNNNIGVFLACSETTLLMVSPFQGYEIWGLEWCEHIPYLNEAGNSFDIRTSATSFMDGVENCNQIKKALKDDSHSYSFPAFDFCMRKGAGWYLPAIDELELFKSPSIINPINRALAAYKADTILPDQESNAFWSSTDTNAIEGENTGAMALKVSKDGNVAIKCLQKGDFLKVLPFYKHCFPI